MAMVAGQVAAQYATPANIIKLTIGACVVAGIIYIWTRGTALGKVLGFVVGWPFRFWGFWTDIGQSVGKVGGKCPSGYEECNQPLGWFGRCCPQSFWRRWKMVILLVLALLGLGVAAYFFWNDNRKLVPPEVMASMKAGGRPGMMPPGGAGFPGYPSYPPPGQGYYPPPPPAGSYYYPPTPGPPPPAPAPTSSTSTTTVTSGR